MNVINKRALQIQKMREINQQLIQNKMDEIEKKLQEKKKEAQDFHDFNQKNIKFELKECYNSIIPFNLFTCWHTKELPPLMQENYDLLIKTNPEFQHFLFDERECQNFIQDNFLEDVLIAYNSLIPASYKSDLWRFCVLYIHGGIYLDIKYKCVNGFKLIALTEKEYFVRDRPYDSTYTALIITKAKNEILLNCINEIVKNVKNKYYGKNPLYPTGPGLLGKFSTFEEREKWELYFANTKIENKLDCYYIVCNNIIILGVYKEYREEQSKYQNNKHYHSLWNERNIYQ
jgi:mannosyltransferase OCH1-like enzyme